MAIFLRRPAGKGAAGAIAGAEAEPAHASATRSAGASPRAIRNAASSGPGRRSRSRHHDRPRRGAGGLATRADRNRQPARLHRAQGRTYRRPGTGQVSRDRRSKISTDHPALTIRNRRSVLCRIRLDWHGRRKREAADIGNRMEAGRLRHAQRQPSGDVDLR